jgi:drug/metabolite transporter (DMT)-like permease
MLFFKETIGVSILIPWLLFRLGQGRFRYTSKRLVLTIVVAAVFCQLIGARLHVLGFAVVGLIIAVPLVQSSTLLGVALIGRFFFGDALSRRRKFAIAILIVAITIISVGKALTSAEQRTGQSDVSTYYFLLVTVGTVIAGAAYAIYITMLRHAVRQYWKDDNSTKLSFKFRHWIGYDHVEQPKERFYSPFPVTFAMSIVFVVGMVVFGTCLCCKHGIAGFFSVPHSAGIPALAVWHCILISGISNTIGFFFQIQGLRMTSAVQASLIAVTQMILLSLMGYLFFHEPTNAIMVFGLGLTIYGVFMSASPEK